MANEQYEQALFHIETALQLIVDMFSESDADAMSAMGAKGEVLCRLDRYEEALPLLQKSAQGYPEFMGENHPKTYNRYMALGDCYARLGQHDNAISTYARAQAVAEKVFVPDSEQLKAVTEKLAEQRALFGAN